MNNITDQPCSPWKGGDTSPARPHVCPDMPARRTQTAPTRKGAAWISLRSLAAIARAGRRGSWGRCSHRETRSSGTGGRASGRGESCVTTPQRHSASRMWWLRHGCWGRVPGSQRPSSIALVLVRSQTHPTSPGPHVSPVWERDSLPPQSRFQPWLERFPEPPDTAWWPQNTVETVYHCGYCWKLLR